MTTPLNDRVRVEDPAFYDESQFAVYEQMRVEAPTFYYEPLDVRLLTRMEDIRAVSTNPAIFSNTGGLTLNQLRMAKSGVATAFERFNDPEGELVITQDPPRQRQLRKVMTPVLAPRYLSTFQPALERLCTAVLDDVAPGEAFDFVETVAARLPILVAAELLGVDDVDVSRMRTWVEALEDLTRVESAEDLEAPGQLFDEMKDFLRNQLAEKRKNPGNDMMSAFLRAREGDPTVGDAVVLAHIATLMSNGGTTRLLMSSLAARFAEHPDLIPKCRDDSDLLSMVIEECLRMDPPARGFVRTVVTETELAGERLRAGERVYMLYPSANRDPQFFDRADTFLPDRSWSSSHASFGLGTHFCMGAGLARMEAHALFTEFTRRFNGIRVEGASTRYEHVQLNGFGSLPVSVEA